MDHKQPNCITCDGGIMAGYEPVVLPLYMHFISGYEPRPSLLQGVESNHRNLGYEPSIRTTPIHPANFGEDQASIPSLPTTHDHINDHKI